MGSGSLLVMIMAGGLLAMVTRSVNFRVTLVLGFVSMALVQSLQPVAWGRTQQLVGNKRSR